MHEGKKFYSDEQIVQQDCQYTCRCEVNTEYSFFMCEPLCKAYYDVMCSDGEEPILEMEDTSVPECKCPRYYCPERQSMAHFIEYVLLDFLSIIRFPPVSWSSLVYAIKGNATYLTRAAYRV